MIYGSLCSGIEAAAVAWNPLGWRCAFVSEIEPFPSAVLKQRHPETPNLGDMKHYEKWKRTKVDVLIGGTPCQPFSVAGLRAGLADPRGNLALVFLGIVKRYKPRWVVWENVPGVHSSWSDAKKRPASKESHRDVEAARQAVKATGIEIGSAFGAGEFEEADQTSDFDCFLGGLERIGYGVATRIFDAQYFGLAQRRRRVFVVGHIGGQWQRAAAVLFERESLCGDSPPSRQARKGVAPTLDGRSGRSGSNSFSTSGGLREVAPTISSRKTGGGGLGGDTEYDGGIFPVAPAIRSGAPSKGRGHSARSGDSKDELIIPINMQAAAKLGKKSPNMLGVGKPGDPAHTVNASDQHAVAIGFDSKQGGDTQLGATIDRSPPLKGRARHAVAHTLKGRGFDASEDGSGRGTPLVTTVDAKNNYDKGDNQHNERLIPEISPAIKQRDHKGLSSDGTGDGAPLIPFDTAQVTSKGNYSHPKKGDPCHPLASKAHPPAVAFQRRIARNGRGNMGAKVNALQAQSGQSGKGDASPCVAQSMAVRRLTPRECERLQGFPDDYTLVRVGKRLAADGPRYKAIGNSFPVPVIRWLGLRMEFVDSL